ncbi:MAG: response regulator transcription factor [Ignavibacteriaceae bacterium]|nr:response regulator transcription factor [Ignavibacteriaceae bacterium]NNL19788.1 response regulator transcription factor [Ignavibacteriaceae bacterium]
MPIGDKKKILVVDDEADVRNFLNAALLEAGFEVIVAEDGDKAIEEVKKQSPDLISLDLVMPKKSGAKFYRELNKNKEWSRIPVIIVTGHARDDLGKADLKELTMSGPGIYLEKPVKPHNYIAAIKKTLNMETTDDEKEKAELVELQSNLKNLIDSSDPKTLKKLKELLNNSE